MQALLNRIEREYIFKLFIQNKPQLTIYQDDNFYYLKENDYQIKNKCILFKNKNLNKKKEVKIFFTHKNRPLYFFSKLEKEGEILYCKISDKLYKDIDTNRETQAFFLLETSNGFKMKAKHIKKNQFKKTEKRNYKTLKNNDDYNFIEKKLLKIKDFQDNKIPELIIKQIYNAKFQKSKTKITTSIIFIDSEFILLFSSQKNAQTIATSISTKAEILFKERKIRASINYSFFYEISNENIVFFSDESKQNTISLYGILCLKITKMHEEDKRFLYELTYNSKYGQKEIQKK